MGPTWYWMPDVFERFFSDFGKSPSDYYKLTRLSPGYRVYFSENDYIDIDDSPDKIYKTFDAIEPGSAEKLRSFLSRARINYDIAIKKLVYKPGLSPTELITKDTIFTIRQFYLTIHDYVSRNFKDRRLQQILEFPVLFLGAKPSRTPLFYSFMNYADFGLGTWYPRGGMKSVIDGIVTMAEELGVQFKRSAAISEISVDSSNAVNGIRVNGESIPANLVITGADYKHSESLLPEIYRSYSEKYWGRKTMAPSSLLFYVGFSKKIKNVLHHTLFFDASFDDHAVEIYDKPSWPAKPLFYASFPGISDDSVIPQGKEAAVFLIPLAPDLEDSEEMREKYFNMIIGRLEKLPGQELTQHIISKKSYCVNDFKDDYNSYRGNAYGLANTLMQTAFLRPGIKSRKVRNLYFTGQLTVPGPGVPPALISGKIVSDLIINERRA
jgi:phytoene desaturase